MVSRPLELRTYQPPSSTFELEIGASSACGKGRAQNSDHHLAIRLGRLQETMLTSLGAADLPPRFEEYAYLLLVADGLDVQGTGSRASRLALSALAHLAIRYGKWNVRVGVENATEIINQGEFIYRQLSEAMFEAGQADPRLKDMATSLTTAYIAGTDLFFAHTGHSRAFLFRDGMLIQLTMEHSLERLISASAALRRVRLQSSRPLNFERKSTEAPAAASEAAGPSARADVSVEHVQLWSGDRVLLCTNGLTDVVEDDLIADALAAQRRPAEDCERLVELALSSGAADDVTVMLADYTTRPAPVTEPDADVTATDG